MREREESTFVRSRREYVSTVEREREGKREGVRREYVTTIEREGESER